MQILPPRKPSYRAAFYADWRWWMSLEKPATVAADPVKSTKWDEFTACRAESSPRVRGAVPAEPRRHPEAGIIPACAGSRKRFTSCQTHRRNHPRVCGEQVMASSCLASLLGSSPRMRGAGSSCDGVANSSGSSPHVRGAAQLLRQGPHVPGIIPACAGSRNSPRLDARGFRDHPRAGGEQAFSKENIDFGAGSSPRMRGAGMAPHTALRHAGIIPAHAGSSLSKTLPSPE